jgi:hypothetical protein
MKLFAKRLAIIGATIVATIGAIAGVVASSDAKHAARAESTTSFAISFPATQSSSSLDGRVILLLSRDLTREPRAHVEPDEPLASPHIFGLNVEALAPGHAVILDDQAFGWPAARLSSLPAGEYLVQAVLNRYESFHLADGRVLKLPPDRGEGQQWAHKPGNLYSTPIHLRLDPSRPVRAALLLDQQIAAIAPKTDSEFVRHIRIRSEMLSHFWGRDVFIGAHVLVPKGFDTHPQAAPPRPMPT